MEKEIYVCPTTYIFRLAFIWLIVNRDYQGLKKLIPAIAQEREAQASTVSLQLPKTPRKETERRSLNPESGTSQAVRTPSSQHHLQDGTAGSPPRHAHYGSSGRTPPLSSRTKTSTSVKNSSTLDALEGFMLPPPARSYTDVDVMPFSFLIGILSDSIFSGRSWTYREEWHAQLITSTEILRSTEP